MPNHVQNKIVFSGDQKQITAMMKKIQNDEFGFGTIDFNKIIPMPESLKIEAGSKTNKGLSIFREIVERHLENTDDATPVSMEDIAKNAEEELRAQNAEIGEEWELGIKAWQNIVDYGFPTWYEWSIANWGTKWNAYGQNENKDGNELQGKCIYLQTAWSAPHPVLQRLSEMYPDVRIEHMWAEEDLGCNCGQRIYFGGEMISEYIPDGLRATDFALDLWGYDPADLGLVMNSTETSYLNVEMEEYQLIELFDKPALFTNERLTASDIPKGFHCYHLRLDDGNRFCTTEKKVVVNHGGSVITKEPLPLGAEKYIALTDETGPNFIGEDITMGQFMRYGQRYDITGEERELNMLM